MGLPKIGQFPTIPQMLRFGALKGVTLMWWRDAQIRHMIKHRFNLIGAMTN